MPRGGSKRGERRGGRKKGTPNKATRNAREAISRLVDKNVPRLQQWLDEIAENEGARAAWQCFMGVIEYNIPRLARTEVAGDGGGPLQIQIVKYGNDSPSA